MQAALHIASCCVCYDVRLSPVTASLVTISYLIVIDMAEAGMMRITVRTSADQL
jgi:hypothetical protein